MSESGLSWSNWAGSVRCTPRELARPATEEALVSLVRAADTQSCHLRVAGSGHSFTPLVETDGILVSLDDYAGIESHDRDALQATVRAGTKLHDLGEPLLALGMAMENLGDIDVQALGGALGTGTHGTGRSLCNISSQARVLRLVTAAGEVVECSAERDPDLWRAARVSVGALGIVSSATLQLLPAYRLHERIQRAPIEDCLAQLEARIRDHRHFEFFWYPPKDLAEMKSLSLTEAEPDDLPDVKGERIGWSAHIISSLRDVKFHEMEYSVPAEAGPACFQEVRKRILERHPNVMWPVEYRSVAPDDAFLSMAHGRPTVTISVHEDGRLPYRDFFADVEPIFWSYSGRPHWGKIHTLGAGKLSDLYPMWDAFHEQRERLDPRGCFLNDHLRSLFAS